MCGCSRGAGGKEKKEEIEAKRQRQGAEERGREKEQRDREGERSNTLSARMRVCFPIQLRLQVVQVLMELTDTVDQVLRLDVWSALLQK